MAAPERGMKLGMWCDGCGSDDVEGLDEWEAEVDRDSFELTMPAEQLEFVMRELVNRSDEALDDCAKQMRCEGDPGFWFPPESLQACANDALDTRAVAVGVLGAA